MVATLRTPVALPLPMVEGYGGSFEESRSRVEMGLGAARMRNRTRRVPRILTLTWDLTQTQYQAFDIWWQYRVEGGKYEFDAQILDDDLGEVAWLTVRLVGEYKAMIVDHISWKVQLVVRSIGDVFYDRPADTDELYSNVEVSVNGFGDLYVPKLFKGSALIEITKAWGQMIPAPVGSNVSIEVDATAMFSARPFWGEASIESINTAKLADLGDPELILQFDAVVYGEPSGDAVILQFDDIPYLPPNVAV